MSLTYMRLALILSLSLLACGWLHAAEYVSETPLLLDAGKPLYVCTFETDPSCVSPLVQTFSVLTGGHRIRVWAALINAVAVANRGTPSACADPCQMIIRRQNGQQYHRQEEVDSSGNPLSPALYSAVGIWPMVEPAMTVNCPLPIEVIGQDRFVKRCQFTASGPPSSGIILHLRLHNDGYQQIVCDSTGIYCDWSTKLAFQVCQGTTTTTCTAWVQVNNTNTTAEDQCKWQSYDGLHCVAGVVRTHEMNVAVPNSALANGANSIAFRFNGTDGITSGARVLEFAFLDSSTKIQLNSISVTSNVATPTCASACGFSSGNDVFVQGAPGYRARFNGLRHVTGGSGSTFTFAPCGSGVGFYMTGCTSPNGTFAPPTTQANMAAQSAYPSSVQAVMYATKVIAPALSTLVFDDPSTYTAPGGGNATTGHTLFTTATLLTPNNPQLSTPNTNNTAVHCSSCHTDDTPWGGQAGMDLKYFAFSNNSIIHRSLFHGLSWQNALDIAAYIRGLTVTVPPMARPFNPVMQPCNGQSSITITSFDAGCGRDSMLTFDADAAEWMAGVIGTAAYSTGTYSNWVISQKLNQQDIPIPYEGTDILEWWPTIHPQDAFPDLNFFASTPYTNYQSFLTALTPQTAASWSGNLAVAHSVDDANTWKLANLDPKYYPGVNGTGAKCASECAGWWNPNLNLANFSLAQWGLIKHFEELHPTLEGLCAGIFTNVYGARPSGSYADRCWFIARDWFNASPHIFTDATHHTTLLDAGRYPRYTGYPSGYNDATWTYLTNSQYVLTNIQNCGNYHELTNVEEDIRYRQGFLNIMGTIVPGMWYSQLMPLIEFGQCTVDVGPTAGGNTSIQTTFGTFLHTLFTAHNMLWNTSADMATMFTQAAIVLTSVGNQYTATQWRTWLSPGPFFASGDTCTQAGRTNAWDGLNANGQCDNLGAFLAVANFWGANSTALANLAAWGNSIVNGSVWTGHDFTTDVAASCSLVDVSGGAMALFWPHCSNMN